MKGGVASIKVVKKDGLNIHLQIESWIRDWTTNRDKEKKVIWYCYAQDKITELDKQILNSKDTYIISIPPRLAGTYKYFVVAYSEGQENKKTTGKSVNGIIEKKITSSKWSLNKDGASIKNNKQTKYIKYGDDIYLQLETEGLNGINNLDIQIYNRATGDDKKIFTYNNVRCVAGIVTLKINNTYSWYNKVKFPLQDIEEFYIKVVHNNVEIKDKLKQVKHAVYLNIKNAISDKKVEAAINLTPTKVGEPNTSVKRYESCKYKDIIITDKDSNKTPFDIIYYSSSRKNNLTKYETIATSNQTKNTIDINFEDITNKDCFASNKHKKEIEIYINNVKQKSEILQNSKIKLPIQAQANTALLVSRPELFFITPDSPKKYKVISNTCEQPNRPVYINVYPNVEREVAFVLTLFPSFSAEINQKYSNREKLTEYNKEKSLQLIRNEIEILYNAKGGIGYGVQTKVKVDNVESSIELTKTKNQIKKLIGFYYDVKEILEPFNGKDRQEASLAYQKKVLPKVTFDIDPPNLALALRITNKKISKTQEITTQFSGAVALKPITKIKIGVDLLSLLQYMGVGGKIADWIKDTLEAKYNFTMYIIFEISLEARGELSLTWNKIEGFAPGTHKLQLEAAAAIKGGVKSTEFVTVMVPESGGTSQTVKVEKWKGEASGTSSLLYSYEVSSDNKGQFSKHKLEFTGLKANITIYSIQQGIKYNQMFKKDFTLIEKPEKPWYESDKEYTI